MKTTLLNKQTFREFCFHGFDSDYHIDDELYSFDFHLKEDNALIKVIVLKYEQV